MRSTPFVFLLIFTLFVHFAQAQSNELIVQGQTGKLFVPHYVEAKETWYSIGRLFNIGPKALATYNSLSMDKPLIIGQEVTIPLTTANFTQTNQKVAGETLLPVYYLVAEKEWMYRISVNHNKVAIGSLEKWNHITKDQVRPGMYMVVGFLKVKTALSAYAKQPPSVPVSTAPVSTDPVASSATPVAPPVNQRSDTTPMTMKPPIMAKKTTAPVGQISSLKVTTKPGDGVTKPGDGVKPRDGVVKPGDGTAAKEGKKTDAPPRQEIVQQPAAKAAAINFNGGYFRSDFTDGSKTANGLAGTFKSTSGWQDGKYYALMNNVTVGTIVRINLPSSNKLIYAKVLGQLPDMKESAGLAIRISNAAASELGVEESKFNVEVRY